MYIEENGENRTVWNYWSLLALWSFTSPCKNLQVCRREKFDHFRQGLNILPWKMLARNLLGVKSQIVKSFGHRKSSTFMWWVAIYTLCLAFMENSDKFRINTPKMIYSQQELIVFTALYWRAGYSVIPGEINRRQHWVTCKVKKEAEPGKGQTSK